MKAFFSAIALLFVFLLRIVWSTTNMFSNTGDSPDNGTAYSVVFAVLSSTPDLP